MENRKLPIGVEFFDDIIKEDFYYVDKTGLIVNMLRDWGKVNLFTRPRRFGKTLTMTMLRSFFEIGGDKSIFDGLEVSAEKELCEEYMGKYPVVFVTLKGVDGLNFETAYAMLRSIISAEATRLGFLLESSALDEGEKQSLRSLMGGKGEPELIRSSLQLLCRLLEKHYGKKTILLIDEYDVPLDKAHLHGYYKEMIDVIRSMFAAALKTNESLHFAVLTGCMRVSKESIFTGLNNLKVNPIVDPTYDEYFGFTDAEVRKMLADYGLESHFEETKDWYDGYLFGSQEIYCPWDVINFCDALRKDPEAEPKLYWINTSGNDLVRTLIDKADDGTTQMEIEDLIAGGTIVKELNETLTHNEIYDNIENIWSLLYMTGYLTASEKPRGGRYTLRIPNREVRQIYMKQVLACFREKARAETAQLSGLYEAFETGDSATIKDFLDELLLDTVSYYDAHESFYHGFLLALLTTCADWRVSSNVETGKGRADIVMMRKDRKLGFVVEVKDVKDEEKLDAACEKAMAQIEEKDYTAMLRRFRVKDIWTYGIAFWDKECRVIAKRAAVPGK